MHASTVLARFHTKKGKLAGLYLRGGQGGAFAPPLYYSRPPYISEIFKIYIFLKT